VDICEDDVVDCVVHQLTTQRMRVQTHQSFPVHYAPLKRCRARTDDVCQRGYYKYRLRQWFLEGNVQIAPAGNLTHLQQRRGVHMSWFENHLVGKRAYEDTMEVSGEASLMPKFRKNLCLGNLSTG
jgi:hypothetical protein